MFEKLPIQPVLEDGEEQLKLNKTEEEIEAEDYVLHKVMVRPAINIFSIILHTIIFICASLGLALLLFLFCKKCLPKIDLFIKQELYKSPEKLFIILFIISIILMFICFLKQILIGLIHLYQKYSPESKRRSCLFKPTCSEFAILALNKYGVIRALPKILDRFKRCHGNKYRIDYP